MRFLVSEKPFETVVAAGQLCYERAGVATGTLESWRLTRVASTGDQILRVDLDARDDSGNSFLYHLILTADNQPQRLTYRYLSKQGRQMGGNVLFTAGQLVNNRHVAGMYQAEEVVQRPFFFPTVIGLGWLARQMPTGTVIGLKLGGDTLTDRFSLSHSEPVFEPQRTRDIKLLKIGRKTHPTTTLIIRWNTTRHHKLWLNRQKWPLKMQRSDGLTAIETRYISMNGE